jgi:nucleotide-binding universal stress UspA family protein
MVIRTGHVSAEIAAAATEGGFDLLVLGGKGRSGLKDLLMGSVAQRVTELSKVPVLLVK